MATWKKRLQHTSSASGTSLGILSPTEFCARVAGDGGAEMRQSQGLGTRGLSESDSPNILRAADVDKGGILPYIRGIIVFEATNLWQLQHGF